MNLFLEKEFGVPLEIEQQFRHDIGVIVQEDVHFFEGAGEYDGYATLGDVPLDKLEYFIGTGKPVFSRPKIESI